MRSELPGSAGRGTVEAGRIARGAAWATLEVWGVELLQLLFFTLLARLLGPGPYGLVALAMAFVMVPQNLIVHGGWTEAVVQRPVLTREHVDASIVALVLAGLVSALVLLATAPLAVRILDLPPLGPVLATLSICPLLTSLMVVPAGLLQRELRLAPLTLRSLVGVSLGGTLALGMAMAGMEHWALVANEIVWPLVGAVFLGIAAGHRPRLACSRRHLAEMARFAAPITGEQAIVLGESFLPRLLLGLSAGPVAVGVWALARKLLDLSSELVARPAMRVALPVLAARADDSAQLARGLGLALQISTLFAVPGYAAAFAFGPELVGLVFGRSWTPAGEALAVLALAGPALAASMLLGTAFRAVGRPGLVARVALLGVVLLIPLLFVSLPFGVNGVATAFACREWLLLAVRLGLVRRVLAVRPWTLLAPLVRVGVAGVAMIVAMKVAGDLLQPAGAPLRLALGLAIGAVGYVAVLLLVARALLDPLGDTIGRALRRPRG